MSESWAKVAEQNPCFRNNKWANSNLSKAQINSIVLAFF
jgi:hypothetical protein